MVDSTRECDVSLKLLRQQPTTPQSGPAAWGARHGRSSADDAAERDKKTQRTTALESGERAALESASEAKRSVAGA